MSIGETKVKSQVNYHIVPFGYYEKYEEVVNYLFNDSENWKCEQMVPQGERIIHHISNGEYNSVDDINEIGYTGIKFVLKNGKRKKYDFFNSENVIYTVTGTENKKINCRIKSIQLYLFKTQVGFLVFDIIFQDADLNTIVDGNYYFKQFQMESASKTYISYKRKISRDKFCEGEFRIKDFINSICKDFKVNTYFEDGPIKKDEFNNIICFPNNSLVYSGVYLDHAIDSPEKELELREYLFRLRRSFKASYKPSNFEFKEENLEVLQNFKNSYWGVSLEGLANIVYTTLDKVTDDFFLNSYFSGSKSKNNGCKLKNIYFYIYLLALHQRYALLNFSLKASKIKEDLNNKDVISELKREIAFYSLKSTFSDVVSITHQAKLYDMIRNSLRIGELMNELNSELEGLFTITKLIEEKEEKFKSDKIERVTMVLSVLGAIALSNDLSDSIRRIAGENGLKINFPLDSVVFLALICFGIGIGLWLNHSKKQ